MNASDAAGVHIHIVEVRFGDCDPAGIVYFPRFFDFFHQAMESWFGGPLASPYDHVIIERKIGFPAVHTEADFAAPSRFGETLAIELRVSKLGRTSIHFDYRARLARADEAPVRVTGKTVCVVIDLDPESPSHRAALPIPDDLRARMQKFAGLSA